MRLTPFDDRWPLSGDTASHARYGVGPATDWATDTGTPIRAPFSGWVTRYWSATGGHTIRLSGWLDMVGQHLMNNEGPLGYVEEGQVLGPTGNSGSMTEGPHFHSWLEVPGIGRVAYHEFLRDHPEFVTPPPRPAGLDVTPLTLGEPLMHHFQLIPEGITFVLGQRYITCVAEGYGAEARRMFGEPQNRTRDELNRSMSLLGIPWNALDKVASAPGSVWSDALDH